MSHQKEEQGHSDGNNISHGHNNNNDKNHNAGYADLGVLECIKTRRTVRKYIDAPVSWELITNVIDAGKAAPSSGNLQNWKFIIVLNKDKRAAIAEACLQQYWMADAPCHIVVCGETNKAIRFYGIRGDRLYTIQNCAAACQNMSLAAHHLGLGSAWVGAFDENMLKRALGIPDEVRPQAVITLGYPGESVPEPLHQTIENVTYFEVWGSRMKYLDSVLGKFGTILQNQVGASIDIVSDELNKVTSKVKEKFKKKKE